MLTTGGTIDKIYTAAGHLEVGEPAAPALLRTAGLAGTEGSTSRMEGSSSGMEGSVVDARVAIESVLRKDSLDMGEADRAVIADRLDAVPCPRVVITHGTDTMTDTAEFLAAQRSRWPEAVIVLTGAMQPASMAVSDAAFNLGAALTAAGLLPPGVYVCMGGTVFPAGTVRKDRDRGRFVRVPPAPTRPGS